MITKQQYLKFWRTMSKGLSEGETVLTTLKAAGKAVGRSPLAKAAEALVRDVNGGAVLSEAMSRHPAAFTAMSRIMVKAGEAGGVLDIVCKRVVEALEKGSFLPPGAAEPRDAKAMQARMSRAFGILLSSGVPVLQAIEMLASETADKKTQAAIRSMGQTVREGGTLSEGLAQAAPDTPKQIIAAVRRAEEAGTLTESLFRIADALEKDDLDSIAPLDIDYSETPEVVDEDGPIIKLVNLVLVQAVKDRASDIHFEPYQNEFKIRYRVDGVLYEMLPPPKRLQSAIVSRLKIMAALDIAEKRLPQDGRIMLKVEGKELDLRVSSVPTVHGERITMRILDRQAVCLDLTNIGLVGETLQKAEELCRLPHGLVICTGPVGSGKTTLLYSMLQRMNTPEQNLMSIEDPVEYDISGVSQIQVRPQIGLTFARAMRSVLRQDPDVIMVGEIRDLETLQVSIQAVLTGHLVLSTLHTNNAPSALRRMLDIGAEPFLVNSATAAIIAQRLVRKLCPECRKEAAPAMHTLPPEVVDYIKETGQKKFYVAATPGKCKTCSGTGYRGRIGIHEILVPNDAVREAVAANAEPATLYRVAVEAGMTPMLIDGVKKAAQGITSLDEVMRVAPRPPRG